MSLKSRTLQFAGKILLWVLRRVDYYTNGSHSGRSPAEVRQDPYSGLRVARQRIADGDRDPALAQNAARKVLEFEPMVRIEYIEIVNPEDMQAVDKIEGPVRVAAAIWISDTRLIDNVLCEPSKKPRRPRK